MSFISDVNCNIQKIIIGFVVKFIIKFCVKHENVKPTENQRKPTAPVPRL